MYFKNYSQSVKQYHKYREIYGNKTKTKSRRHCKSNKLFEIILLFAYYYDDDILVLI